MFSVRYNGLSRNQLIFDNVHEKKIKILLYNVHILHYKIGIVVPTVLTVSGNRTAILLAKELNKFTSASFVCYEIKKDLIEQVEKLLSPGQFFYKKTIENDTRSKITTQFFRKRDKRLSEYISSLERYDVIVVISNEGKFLSNYLKKLNPMVITAISIMELNDHFIFIPYRNKQSLSPLRLVLFSLPYGILRIFEKDRYKSFDLIFSNSTWTSVIFQYLYNIESIGNIILVDNKIFKHINCELHNDKFIALPTVSLDGDKKGQEIARKLVEDGINIVSYGPNEIPGITYLGFLSQDKLVHVLSDATGVLFLFDYEALGLVPFEALACGTKVITYNFQGPISELRGNTNVIFCNDNYMGIKEACLRVLSESKNDASILKCVQSVEKYFPEENTNTIYEIIKKTIEDRKPNTIK